MFMRALTEFGSANEGQRCKVTSYLIGWTHTQLLKLYNYDAVSNQYLCFGHHILELEPSNATPFRDILVLP